jgi:hypothetical protein
MSGDAHRDIGYGVVVRTSSGVERVEFRPGHVQAAGTALVGSNPCSPGELVGWGPRETMTQGLQWWWS